MTAATPAIDKTQIRDAATVIVLRDRTGDTPRVLMGQRGAKAAFMPNKFVFPGGAVDVADAGVPFAKTLSARTHAQLTDQCVSDKSHALAAAAIRELWEETGQILGAPMTWDTPVAEDWQGFADCSLGPDASGLDFVFRAITPPGRPRRFDARFFLVDGETLATDLDDFSRASDELSNLQWIPLDQARQFDLPFITQVVLAEVIARLPDLEPLVSVPFFNNDDEESLFLRLNGTPLRAEA